MRIVSLAPSNTEILFALGVADQVVGVTRFCDWPPEAKKKAAFGSWLATEEQKIKDLKPDVILTSMWMPEPLREWAGPGEVVHVDPKNLWDVLESIRHIGDVVGATAEAKKIVANMESEFAKIRDLPTEGRPRVYMEEWFDPPMAAGNWVPELVAIAGGEEVMAEINQPSKAFSLAALVVADPDLVVCHWCGWGERTQPERILDRPAWQEIPAIAEKRVVFMNDSLINRPGPRLVEGAAALHALFVSYG